MSIALATKGRLWPTGGTTVIYEQVSEIESDVETLIEVSAEVETLIAVEAEVVVCSG